jgi:hypothetical protein
LQLTPLGHHYPSRKLNPNSLGRRASYARTAGSGCDAQDRSVPRPCDHPRLGSIVVREGPSTDRDEFNEKENESAWRLLPSCFWPATRRASRAAPRTRPRPQASDPVCRSHVCATAWAAGSFQREPGKQGAPLAGSSGSSWRASSMVLFDVRSAIRPRTRPFPVLTLVACRSTSSLASLPWSSERWSAVQPSSFRSLRHQLRRRGAG